jgi:hypothetical protein
MSCYFPRTKVETCCTYWRFFKITIYHSPIIFKMASTTFQKISMNKQIIFGVYGQIYYFYAASNSLLAVLTDILKLEQWTNRNQEFIQ